MEKASVTPLHWRQNILTKRLYKPTFVALVFLGAIAFLNLLRGSYTVPGGSFSVAASFQSNATASHPLPGTPAALDFWRRFAKLLADTKPTFKEIERNIKEGPWMTYDALEQHNERPDNLNLSKGQFSELKELHHTAVETIRELAPALPFTRGTRGVVVTANSDALTTLTTSLWMLRLSGSTLPVEIWFENYDTYEEVPCNEIYPSLDARCMFMCDYLPEQLEHPLHLVKFTYKTMALAFSTFEQILFLDMDAFPVMNPDSIFETEPFTSKGWVLWPDYWALTSSHYFYEIIEKPIPDLKDRASTESGFLLINKATHSEALLMVQFYNTWGEEHWYRLLGQGAPGEGDKDTYLAAAQVFKLPFYQIWHSPQRIGYRCEEHKRPVGSAVFHPFDDWIINENGIKPQEEGFQLAETLPPRTLFLHGNLPKYDPHILLDWGPEGDVLRCNGGKGEAHRLWGPKDLAVIRYGWDPEHAVWDILRWEACVHEKDYKTWTEPSFWRPNPRSELCKPFSEHWDALFPGESWVPPSLPNPVDRKERAWGRIKWPHMKLYQ